MKIEEIKREAALLTDKEKRELVAFLIHQSQMQDPQYLQRITAQIDDTSDEKWTRFRDIRADLLG